MKTISLNIGNRFEPFIQIDCDEIIGPTKENKVPEGTLFLVKVVDGKPLSFYLTPLSIPILRVEE